MEERNDRDLKELFSAARKADRTSVPPFARLFGRTDREARPSRVRRWFGVAALSTAGSAVVVLGAIWLTVKQPVMEQPELLPEDAGYVVPVPPLPVEPDAPPQVEPVPVTPALPEPVPEPVPEPTPAQKPKQKPKPAPQPAPLPPPPPFPARNESAVTIAERLLERAKREKLETLGYTSGRKSEQVVEAAAERPRQDLDLLAQARGRIEGVSQGLTVYQKTLTLAPGSAGVRIQEGESNTEAYDTINENVFLSVTENPLSTFSIDVDTASYANVRRFLAQGQRPPRDAVRIEELINYFDYDYPEPRCDDPFSSSLEIAGCPSHPEPRLARIGLTGKEVSRHSTAGSNLVFLIDVSGSMNSPKKLPLLRSSLALLVDGLETRDQVAIVVYAGSSGVVLPSTSGAFQDDILSALKRLRAGGSTNGASGIELAYEIARENFVHGGINRVILATDGDFNVGITNKAALLGLIQEDARDGIFLTTLGFGMGNYKDDMLELLADRGNGNYAYIDSLKEARKVLVEELSGTLMTIAKDVKIQVEFNPAEVGAYRLIGYENRLLAKQDFNDDRKDAGEIGSGHTVTALYEVVPPGRVEGLLEVDALKYQTPAAPSRDAGSGEMLTLKLRFKRPEGRRSRLLAFPVRDDGRGFDQASVDFKFASAVAAFGMLLRGSEHAGACTLDDVGDWALAGTDRDPRGYRADFQDLIHRAKRLR